LPTRRDCRTDFPDEPFSPVSVSGFTAAAIAHQAADSLEQADMRNERSLNQAGTRPPHHNNFGFVRLYLAFGVFLGHYAWIFPNSIVPPHLTGWLVGEDGLNGVRAFFIISGYFLFRSYRSSPTVLSYVRKRANRVLPAYIAVILAASVLGFFLTTLSAADYLSADLFKYIFWNLLFLNFMHPTLPGVFQDQPLHLVNSSLWTLKIEISFYLSVPIIAFACRSVRLPVLFACLYIGSVVYAHSFDYLFHATGRPIYHTLAMQMPGQLCYFLSGALLEHYRVPFERHGKLLAAVAVVTILLSFLLSIDVLYPIAFGILVIGICTLVPYLGNWEKYGDFSYSLYIFHFPILQTFCALGLLATHPLLHFLAVVSTVFAITRASWTLVESRFLTKRSVVIPAVADVRDGSDGNELPRTPPVPNSEVLRIVGGPQMD
jgi:peptidoglycan/LPS O-acetylase OafA/YrhL